MVISIVPNTVVVTVEVAVTVTTVSVAGAGSAAVNTPAGVIVATAAALPPPSLRATSHVTV